MNSPVACLPDPIQNMTKKKTKTKTSPNTARKNRLQTAVRANSGVPRGIPLAMGGTRTKSILPQFSGSAGRMIVQNYEFVFTLKAFATDTFASLLNTLPLNAGNANFPWLSPMALNYSKFRWHYLRFIYVPSVPTTVPGKVAFSIQYDYADNPPTTVAQMAVSDSTSIGPAWIGGGINSAKAFDPNLNAADAIFIDFDCDRQTQDYYYVRSGSAGVDITPGVLNVVSSGANTGAAVTPYGGTGDCYVSYICEFFEPVAPALNV